MRSADTTPAARALQLSVYRRLAGAERLAIAIAMSEDLKAVAAAGTAWRGGALPEGAPAPT
jgi:hypothetical protein